ncbi:CLUMA_CG019391, isoform A [Clunio marinus]|uniref:CLUMA_CG019391, isoform A n=1 Tax=Clunio marinus TaxID=568069 RepID=A0A1J1J122_9DIPT|nr:CLUMA_CG019391, isoform A [Clunio marinus]
MQKCYCLYLVINIMNSFFRVMKQKEGEEIPNKHQTTRTIEMNFHIILAPIETFRSLPLASK